MSSDNAGLGEAMGKLSELLSSDVYKENLAFWEKAWGMVKTPYTQFPDLPYILTIPELLSEHGSKTVLDLGCGSGWLTIFLAQKGFSVTGIDISPQAVRLGQQWADQENLKARFESGDLSNLPYSAGSFDAVVGNSIFEHFTFDLAQSIIDRLKTILRPGGILIGCFDQVGMGPGEYYKLDDGTHVYTDKGRKGMMLRCFSDEEIGKFFSDWNNLKIDRLESGSRFVTATT